MGVPCNSLLDLLEKVRSWISWEGNGILSLSSEFNMAENGSEICKDCELRFTEFYHKYNCLGCGSLLCGSCIRNNGSLVIIATSSGLKNLDRVERVIKACKFCSKTSKKHVEKIHPSESPPESPEPPSPSSSGEKMYSDSDPKAVQEDCASDALKVQEQSFSLHTLSSTSSLILSTSHPSPMSVRHSPIQSDEEAEDSGKHFFNSFSEYYHDGSDIDTSVSFRNETYSFRSVGSTPTDSPSRININPPRAGYSVQHARDRSPKIQNDGPVNQESTAILAWPERRTQDPDNCVSYSDDFSTSGDQDEKFQKLLGFESNSGIWRPPPPEDEDYEAKGKYFEYDDDDDEIGESGGVFSYSSSLASLFPAKEKQNDEQKEPLKAIIQGHFKALVLQLLHGEGINVGNEIRAENWLEIVSNLAWQAANFVRPDTTKGGSMDPGDYVKVKCIASGTPSESVLVKGVVCTKNIKHKRMTSQYKNPRLILLGGSLEYQRAPNQLTSFNTLLEEEMNHLKMIVSKIEAHRPNVLLVEKSVSPYAQEYLLEKEISLVLNVKRPLLERIARCTGASVNPSVNGISMARAGHCELFRLEKVYEELEPLNQSHKRQSKTLMFFEGCPRRLGCTVLLKGSNRNELKKIKHVVQYAVFAAYHLSLETSFLADEGAHLPKMTLKPSLTVPEKIASHSTISTLADADGVEFSRALIDFLPSAEKSVHHRLDDGETESSLRHVRSAPVLSQVESRAGNGISGFCDSSIFEDATECSFTPRKSSPDLTESMSHFQSDLGEPEKIDENEVSGGYFSATDSHQSILVSFSSHCVPKGTLCERSRLLRIKFYGSFDKPLGKYLRDDLLDQASYCRTCKEPVEAHVQCFTHQQGSLTINVRHLKSISLGGERDGKIWMWHRCLRCEHVDGVPPATHRVIMSDAAWGLSFGKFLELSFSNNATANRLAGCGHSLQRDCLRFYGFGSTVAYFHYLPIDILSVHLPPSVLEFGGRRKLEWLKREAAELTSKMETVYAEISDVLNGIEQKSKSLGHASLESSDLHEHILRLKDLLDKERSNYHTLLLQAGGETPKHVSRTVDILELNRLKQLLLLGSQSWDCQLYSLDSLLNSTSITTDAVDGNALNVDPKGSVNESSKDTTNDTEQAEHVLEFTKVEESSSTDEESPTSDLSEKIDSAWIGTDSDVSQPGSGHHTSQVDVPFRRLLGPERVYSFDSAMRMKERSHKGLPPSSLHLLAVKSFHASGDYRNMLRDPTISRTFSQVSVRDTQQHRFTPSYVFSSTQIAEGPRLLHPQPDQKDLVVAVYEDEPTSIISYALCSKEHEDWVSDKSNEHIFGTDINGEDSKRSPHLRVSFEDNSKFSVMCYFAKQFDMLRKRCCPSEVDFVCSLSRCRRWSAQGGKSNVYFAKSMDERFVIKQVTKTELDSFEEFAAEYFKYLSDTISQGSPTCLAKVLGIYQVAVKNLKGGKEIKMDVMVMENLFFQRNISRVYDLKGSSRSRYNPDTTGGNKVLLDMNLLETLRKNPVFLGSKAKRWLERAVWNDTSFLASIDVMDYSLLVGVDEERKELVLGIIDFMRQYTWDKHLETWVKASGILGGPKNASPTVVSPIQYKKRFRKAMTSYFLTVPDQWSS